jgi:hypothetical protein
MKGGRREAGFYRIFVAFWLAKVVSWPHKWLIKIGHLAGHWLMQKIWPPNGPLLKKRTVFSKFLQNFSFLQRPLLKSCKGKIENEQGALEPHGNQRWFSKIMES